MNFIYVVLSALFGMAIASFLNVVIDRLPVQGSLLAPPSHCPSCGHRLAVKDLIPVVSYLRLRGRCGYCQASIPRRLLVMEAGMGLVFPLLYWHYGMTLNLVITTFYVCLFTVIMVIDLDHGIIPDKIVFPAAVVSLIIAAFMPGQGILQAIIGGGVGFGIFLLIVILSSLLRLTAQRQSKNWPNQNKDSQLWKQAILNIKTLLYRRRMEPDDVTTDTLRKTLSRLWERAVLRFCIILTHGGMGLGDVKLAALIGIITGFPAVLVAILLAIFGGGFVSIMLLLTRRKRLKEGIPFGPFLSIGAVATIIWGAEILRWYLGLFPW